MILNGRRLKVNNKSERRLNGGSLYHSNRLDAATINGLRARQIRWNGHNIIPPHKNQQLYLYGYPAQGATILDFSSNSNNGTIHGAIWKQLPSNIWYLSYDGTDDWTEIDDNASLDITGNITVSAWVYPTDLQVYAVGQRVVLAKGKRVAEVVIINYLLEIAKDGAGSTKGRIRYHIFNAGWGVSQSDEVVELNKWQKITATFIPATDVVAFGHNGVLAGVDAIATVPIANNEHLTVGCLRDDAGFHVSALPFKGSIALASVENIVRTVATEYRLFQLERRYFGV